jgi:flagellar hook-length control protein FliK
MLILPTAVEGFAQPPPQPTQKAVCSTDECQISFRERLAKAKKAVSNQADKPCEPTVKPQPEEKPSDPQPVEGDQPSPETKSQKTDDPAMIILTDDMRMIVPPAVCPEVKVHGMEQVSQGDVAGEEIVSMVDHQASTPLLQMNESVASFSEAVDNSLENTTVRFQVEQPKPVQIENEQLKSEDAKAVVKLAEDTSSTSAPEIKVSQPTEAVVEKPAADHPGQSESAPKVELRADSQSGKTTGNHNASPQTNTGNTQNQSDAAKPGDASVQVENPQGKGKAAVIESGRADVKNEDPPPQQTAPTAKVAEATTKPIEPARLAEAHRPELVSQVARGLENFAKSGQHSVRLQLYPETLGRIDLRLVSNAEGVQIVMNAEQPATSFMLERHLHTLKESLAQAGVNLTGLFVGDGRNQSRPDLPQRSYTAGGQFTKHTASILQNENQRPQGIRLVDSSSNFDYRI